MSKYCLLKFCVENHFCFVYHCLFKLGILHHGFVPLQVNCWPNMALLPCSRPLLALSLPPLDLLLLLFPYHRPSYSLSSLPQPLFTLCLRCCRPGQASSPHGSRYFLSDPPPCLPLLPFIPCGSPYLLYPRLPQPPPSFLPLLPALSPFSVASSPCSSLFPFLSFFRSPSLPLLPHGSPPILCHQAFEALAPQLLLLVLYRRPFRVFPYLSRSPLRLNVSSPSLCFTVIDILCYCWCLFNFLS